MKKKTKNKKSKRKHSKFDLFLVTVWCLFCVAIIAASARFIYFTVKAELSDNKLTPKIEPKVPIFRHPPILKPGE